MRDADHKYDPIPTTDLHALSGGLCQRFYKEYPQVPKSVVDDYKTPGKEIEIEEKAQGEFFSSESKQLAETLCCRPSKYAGGLEVKGEPKGRSNR